MTRRKKFLVFDNPKRKMTNKRRGRYEDDFSNFGQKNKTFHKILMAIQKTLMSLLQGKKGQLNEERVKLKLIV